jgi:hypothetical protein
LKLDESALLPLVGSTRIAVVSNSSVVHLLDHATSSKPLIGHTDIVLAVQCSPDGYQISQTLDIFDISLGNGLLLLRKIVLVDFGAHRDLDVLL